MPTYEYECSACGTNFELFQGITESPKRKCPHCGRLKARRLIGAGSGIIFKGSGFYQTDYRSEEYKRKAKAEKDNTGAKHSDSSEKKGSSGEKKSSANRTASE